MIITIDGPAGTGKSTTARKVSEALGYSLLDTGAMYRAITSGIIEHKIDHQNPEELKKFLTEYPLKIVKRFGERRFFIGSVDVTDKIRSNEVTSLVSTIASYPDVRAALVPLQRQAVSGINAVCEGRDMGTTVYPDADLKVYLTANLDVRAQRRYLELKQLGRLDGQDSLEEVKKSINNRDTIDSTREHSPLKPAADAVLIDTSTLSLQQVVDQIINLAEQRSD